MISFINVGSGSKGNATFIYDEKTLLMVDCGLPLCRLKEALDRIGRGIEEVSALFITHEHSDHICGLGKKALKHIKIYASEGTIKGEHEDIDFDEIYQIGTIMVQPIHTSHDAANPAGYIFISGNDKLVYVTDTGYVPDESLPLMGNAKYYIFESNHDYRMLMASHRPPLLKKRIHSDVGHLSNTDCASYMMRLIGEDTKGIYLAHLSEECNTPELALETFRKAFMKKHRSLDGIKLAALKQYECTEGGDGR